jgi:hypothetical protein
MQFKTATHIIIALASLASLTSLASAQIQQRHMNITTDAAGTHYIGFRPRGGALEVHDYVDTWTLAVTPEASPIQGVLTDANGYGVVCPLELEQVCYSTSDEGRIFVFEPSTSTPGAYAIRESTSARYWIVEDNDVYPAGTADSQAFYLHLD